jgi:hypothetical protein
MLNINRFYKQSVIVHKDGEILSRYTCGPIKDANGNEIVNSETNGKWVSTGDVKVDREEIYIRKYPGRLEKELEKFKKTKV